jgi:hypothetical protein
VKAETVSRLQSLDIAWFATEKGYTMFTRGICAAVGHENSVGSSGLMTESGLAFLIWREERAYLVAHGSEQPATAEQVEAIRRFSSDLKSALGTGTPAP